MTRSLAAAAAALTLLAGCDPFQVAESASERFAIENPPSVPRVEVRVADGRIEVVGTISERIEIEVDKTAYGMDREGARALLDALVVDVRETDRGVRVETRGGGGRLMGGHLRTELLVRVPSRADLDLRSGDGSIRVEGVEGSITVESADGRIELRDLRGAIRARASDGSISGSELRGRVDVRTDDGRIELDGDFDALEATTSDGSIRVRQSDASSASLREPWTLRSSDGSIRLSLPASLSAELEASAMDGSIDLDLPRFSGTREQRRFRGTLGSGGALILLVTMDGSIRIEES